MPTTLVTGANRGIGLEVARALWAAGHHVLLAARTEEKAALACDEIASGGHGVSAGTLEPWAADLASLEHVARLGEQLAARPAPLDAVVHNAAVIEPERTVTVDGLERTFQVNHLAPFALTQSLLPALERSADARIVVVASEAHRRGGIDLDDVQFARRRYRASAAYSQSKLANILFTRALARRLEGGTTRVAAVHPGVVSTGLLARLFGPLAPLRRLFRAPASGAAPVVALATMDHEDLEAGAYFRRFDRVSPSATAQDETLQEALWEYSDALVRTGGSS